MKYRSKVVEIEAVQFNPKSREYFSDMPAWLEAAYEVEGIGGVDNIGKDVDSSVLQIRTLEGTMTAQQGDWIIRGTEGELYPCKPSVFERKYEAIDALADLPSVSKEDGLKMRTGRPTPA